MDFPHHIHQAALTKFYYRNAEWLIPVSLSKFCCAGELISNIQAQGVKLFKTQVTEGRHPAAI